MAAADKFEVQVYVKDHWVTEDFCDTEREAQASAQEMLGNSTIGGVRILKAKTRGGQETERVIYTKMREATIQRSEAIRVAPIEEAPVCDTVDDLFRPEARLAVSRVLKPYLDRFVLTPTELLHNPREMKRVLNFESLAPSAVSRVAAVQTRAGEGPGRAADVGKRNAVLHDLVNGAAERAREAASTADLPVLKDHTLGWVLGQLDHQVPANQQTYYATVVLCRELVEMRSWLGKLESLLGLIKDEQDPRAKQVVDPVIADIFGSADALRDVLGRQPDLATALLRAIDVAEGRRTEDENTPSVTNGLAERLTDSGLSGAQRSLFLAISRQLKSGQPLTHRDGGAPLAAFRSIADRLVKPTGVIGGPVMAEALVLGAQRFVEQGGETGKRMSLERTLGELSDVARQGVLILELFETDLGRQLEGPLRDRLTEGVKRARDMSDLAPANLSLKDRMQRVAGLYARLQLSTLPNPGRQELTDHIDALVADFVVEGKLVERLDDPMSSLRQRAVRLAQFCASDVLTKPKAHSLFRERMVAHLRQPQFEEAFVSDIENAAQRQTALRDFYGLLRKAGFQ